MTEIELMDKLNPKRELPQATCDVISVVYKVMNNETEKLKAEIIEIEKVSDERFDKNEELKALIGKMKNVGNCKHAMDCAKFNEKELIYGKLRTCKNCKDWELAE